MFTIDNNEEKKYFLTGIYAGQWPIKIQDFLIFTKLLNKMVSFTIHNF